MKQNAFVKTHGLGNDYIVLDSENIDFQLTEKAIVRLCDEHFGIGSDGILLKAPSKIADFGLLIYNPDGSKAENCGNGLRIFTKYLSDYGFTRQEAFTVDIMGRLIRTEILGRKEGKVNKVRVGMGKAVFHSPDIPLVFHQKECINEPLEIEEKCFHITCVSVGNPHCVVLRDELSEEELLHYAPKIQAHPMFPKGTNVQFARVNSRSEVEIRIYERGAGYTLASGSSSCAVAAAMLKNGHINNDVNIKMPGGQLRISVSNDWHVMMTGTVREICSGILSREWIEDKDL